MIEPVNTPDEQIVAQKEESEKGASLVEYALLVALIAIVCIAAITALGGSISKQFSGLSNQLTTG